MAGGGTVAPAMGMAMGWDWGWPDGDGDGDWCQMATWRLLSKSELWRGGEVAP